MCRVPQLAIHLDRDVNERGLDPRQATAPHSRVGNRYAATGRVRRLARRPDRRRGRRLSRVGPVPVRSHTAGESSAVISRCWPRPPRQPGVVLGCGRRDLRRRTCRVTPPPSSPCSTTKRWHRRARPVPRVRCWSMCSNALPWQRVRRAPTSCAQLATSTCVSADNAHAVHPNYRERHEPEHQPIVNKGPAIKLNSNQRYATSARSAAMLQRVLRRGRSAVADLRQPQQHAVRHHHRTDHRDPPRYRDRRRRCAAVVDALGPRAVRRRRPDLAGDAVSATYFSRSV